ncbi:MAG: NADH-quinone oxidoreductase subunit N, partial [Deltaproteobacteria bacterium]|nr:NADH-quinone oxidoreductase subunit N [Deltaproteobacteria bacterium]
MLKFTLPAMNYMAVLPEIILILAGMSLIVIGLFKNREKSGFMGAIALFASIAATLSIFAGKYTHHISSTFGGMILTDGFSFFFSLVICAILILTILVSINYQTLFEHINSGEYYALLFFATTGMLLMAKAGNLILLFVALETMSISIYALSGFHKDELKSTEAALKYFLLGAFSSGFLLYGFALVFGATGSLDIVTIGAFLVAHPAIIHSKLLVAGLALMTAGFGFKVSMVPFHMWTPDTYEGAPTSITGFMATGVKAAAFAALIRVILVPLAPLQGLWIPIMWAAALATMTIGNIIALAQENIKRMLAYSSIAHAGYILVGFVAGTRLAQTGMLFYLMGYAFMNLGAFGVVALVGKREKEYTNISDFTGLGAKYPLLGIAMAVFMFSLAGIPPTAGFMGKFYIFTEALKSGYVWLVIFAGINSVVSIYYYLRIVVVMYFSPAKDAVSIVRPAAAAVAGLAAATLLVLAMGIFPGTFWEFARQSIFSLV